MKRQISDFIRYLVTGITLGLAATAGVVSGGGGSTGTGFVAFGDISDFGSIFVNGIEFFTNNASITINGVPNRPESDLRVGMVLKVTGGVNSNGTTGNAATVDYQADAIGLVDSQPIPGLVGGNFSVLGQAVSTDARTVFSGVIGFEALNQGDFVEVSGFQTPSGLLARRVEKKTSFPTVQVKGTAANATPTGYSVGALTVDYSIAIRKNVPASGIANGQLVVANGPTPVNGVLTATSVEIVNQSVSGNQNGSYSGLVDAYSGGSTFVVNGLTLTLTSNTQFVNGNRAALANGKLVKADFLISGTLAVATKVEFVQLKDPAVVEADVTFAGPNYFELLGPGGVSIIATSATQWKDSVSNLGSNLRFPNLAVGDHMVVRGNYVDQAVVQADRIDRRKPAGSEVIGRVLNAQLPSFTMLDVVLTTTAATTYFGANGVAMTSDAFFAVAAGHKADAIVVRSGSQWIVTTIRLT